MSVPFSCNNLSAFKFLFLCLLAALHPKMISKLKEGDTLEIIVDQNNLTGSINFIGEGDERVSVEAGAKILAARIPSVDLSIDSEIPDDTRLWAMLQQSEGGTWASCDYDVEYICETLERGMNAKK